MFAWLADASAAVAATSKRNDKVAVLAEVIERVHAGDSQQVEDAVAYLTGDTPVGRLGIGYATLRRLETQSAASGSLSIAEVTASLREIVASTGSGSRRRRHNLLASLFAAATPVEQEFLTSVIAGELRQGALDGVVATAVARAAGVPVASVQRAAMFLGSLPAAATTALDGGRRALDAVALRPGVAVQPMLASSATSPRDVLTDRDALAVQWKFDGVRIQAHRTGDEVRLYTRNLNEVTTRLPGVVADVERLGGGDLVLDGEVMGRDIDGRPRPFQDTMGDFTDSDGAALGAFWFDLLAVEGESIVDERWDERFARLTAIAEPDRIVPTTIAHDAAAIAEALAEAVEAGHEGIVAKRLDSAYEAGRRGKAWRKLKPVYTYELVVLAAEWGHGRRTGWLSNLHLGARDPNSGDFVMVGKTFKGLTDEVLAWQTERLLTLETGRDGHTVYVRPELVVEVAIDGVQRSSRYRGGIALRFARVKRYRSDRDPGDADTIGTLVGAGGVR